MKVLAISSSPRRAGNSEVLCNQFLKGASKAGHKTQKIQLAALNISPCAACHACVKTHKCIKNDDMATVQQALIDADVIVLATPVYFYSLSAQMKILIDRCLPRHREIENKNFYFIITAAASLQAEAEVTVGSLRGFLRMLPGAKEQETIYGMGAFDKGDVYRHPAFEKAYEIGKNLKGENSYE